MAKNLGVSFADALVSALSPPSPPHCVRGERTTTSLLQIVALSFWLLASGGALAGCNQGKANEAEVAPNHGAVKQSYEGLESKLGARRNTAAALRKRFDALPQDLDLPGMADVRGKLFSAEEVLGVTHARLTWLGARLESALKEKRSEELIELSNEIAATKKELVHFDRISVELTHELGPLERMNTLLKEGAEEYERVLSTGYELKGGNNGIERQLVEFLEDPGTKLDPNSWFAFDRILFGRSDSELDLRLSQRQLKNVSEILKAYPRVKVKIGGFTDSANSAEVAKKLSSVRAVLIQNELVLLGVAASRIQAVGYGPAHPICKANDTDECRARNRRIAVNVTVK